MKFSSAKTIVICFTVLLPSMAIAQTTGTTNSQVIILPNSEVPFLNLTPDSRSGGLGEAGVAISPDVNANYWNPSKLAFLESDDNFSLSYSPWLRQLVPDISLSYLSYAHKIDNRNAIGASIRYFNYGTTQLTDGSQNSLGTFTPNEFSINGAYSRKFGEDFSLGLSGAYIYSNYSSAGAISGTGQQNRPGNAFAAGVSMYYTNKTQQFDKDAVFSFGANISNIGSKITYVQNGPKYFLPTNLKIGFADAINLDDFNQVTFTVDFNKLLIPTPPQRDGEGNIVSGKDDQVSVPAGIFGSFSDAPGGFSQNLKEITFSPGLEYWYDQLLALRLGYFYTNPNTPNGVNIGYTHYLTSGVGFKYQEYSFDFSYIIARQQYSPLANTIRFTLIANFGGDKNTNKR